MILIKFVFSVCNSLIIRVSFVIGIFDSGIGGLTVVKEIKKQLPGYKLIYFGDTARLPYGTKSKSVVLRYSIENSNFLISRGAKIIVIACHTASSLVGGELKIFFTLPVFDVINPVIKKLKISNHSKRIGVIGTPSTISSNIFQRKLKKYRVFSRACPLFVPLVEENWIKKPETYSIAENYLSPLKRANIDSLILACTHYPLLKSVIDDIMDKRVELINPAEELAQELKKFIEKERPSLSKGKSEFYVSDEPYRFERLSRDFLGESIKVRKVSYRK